MTQGRFVLAASVLLSVVGNHNILGYTNPTPISSFTSKINNNSHNYNAASSMHMTTTMSSDTESVINKNSDKYRPNPIVVSAKAESLSHSPTTMKLTPSYELFQMLTLEEGGEIPATAGGNAQRDADILKIGIPDTLGDLKLSSFEGLGGKTKIDTLPDPFKMVEKELQPFSDSITELVSSDQPILSMAAKHFFEKRHGKRFRPTIVQLVAKAVAASVPEQQNDLGTNTEHSSTSDDTTHDKPGGAAGWEWSGASTIELEGGVVTQKNHKGS